MGKSLGLLAAALLTGVPGAASAQDEFEFTGKWTVVYPVYPKEHDGLRQAALYAGGVTFADVMKEALGLRIGVYSEDKVPADAGHRVYIGGKFAEQAGLMPADFRGWDYGMAEKDGDLYFFGHDQPGANPRHDSRCVNPSVLAVARFLQERVGVLFLMPGRIGREVPKLERLMLPKRFFGRGTLRFEYNGGRGGDYLHYLANGMGGHGRFHTYGGHTYTAACPRDKYFETNPEFFAKDANGKPIRGGSNGCQAYCISNPVFRKMVYEEMLRRYDAGALSCQLGQNDGAAGLCKCKACFDLYGTGDDWSEKIWLYHREIAERLLKDRPGKIVHIICYGDTAKPPKTFKVFPENVMIENCKYDEEAIRQWDGYIVPQGFTYYLYNWGWYQILGLTPHRSVAGLVDQVKRLHSRGLKGIYRCGYGELFGMEGPVYWVFDHLLVDPTLDPKALLATYYRGAFGPAAAPMKRFYEDLEEPLSRVEKRNSTEASDLVESTIRRTRERDPVSALAVVYTPERVRRMDAALEAAETTKGLSEKQVRRLRLVRAEWTYVRNVGSIAYLYEQFRIRPTKDLCRRIMSLVKERNAILDRYIENGRVRNIKGWEQLTFLGNPPLDQFRENGRLSAPIKEPLNWDIGRMEKYGLLPTVLMTPAERAKEMKGLRPITGFKPAGTFDGGAFFEPYEDGTGFRFGQGTNRYVRVSVRVGKDQGLEPGKTYRVTWLTRWEHVKSDRPWKGYSFLAMKGPWGPNDLNKVKMPESSAYAGTSAGWVRESVLLPVCDKPGFSSEFSFRFWEGSDGIAEVRDVTVEEVL